MTEDLDAMCADYVARLEAALSDVAPDDRRQITEQIAEHIANARAALPVQSESAVRDILERLGSPEEIAAEASTQTHPSVRRRGAGWRVGTAAAIAVVALGLGLAAALGAFSGTGAGPTAGNIVQSDGSRTSGSTAGAPKTVAVPVVTGLQVTIASQSLQDIGLSPTLRFVTSEQPVGTVLEQRPSAGSFVAGGAHVSLTVSGTTMSVTVPDVIGMSQAMAQAMLVAARLEVTVGAPVPNGHVPAGVVFAQAPAAGSEGPRGSEVSVTVSAGPS